MSEIKFGVQVEPQFGFTYPEVLEIAKRAESLGFESLWSSDHFFLNEDSEDRNCLESWTLISSLAGETEDIRLGNLVLGNSYRNPSLVAKMSSTLDHITGGRLEFGIGAGWKEIEYDAYGYPYPSDGTRLDQLEEAVQVIKAMWTEERATFDGEHYQIRDAFNSPKPVQKPHPPVFVGGGGIKKTLRIAAAHGDYCNWGWWTPFESTQEKLAALESHCRDVGRDYGEMGKSYFAYCLIGETEEEVDELLTRFAERRSYLESEEDVREKMTGMWIGTPEEVIGRIEEFTDLGFTYFQVMFRWTEEERNQIPHMELFAEEVMPSFT